MDNQKKQEETTVQQRIQLFFDNIFNFKYVLMITALLGLLLFILYASMA